MFLISAGFLFDWDQWNAGISGTLYFYNDESYNVQSETVGDLSGFLSYDLNIVEISVLASTFFNNENSADFFAGLMLDRAFFNKNQSFLIDPTLTIYAGSQYFYEAYYNTSRLGNRKGKGMGSAISQPTENTPVMINEASKFQLLSIETSLPMHYQYKHFIFSFTPVLALPQSSPTIITEDEVIKEELKSVFYFSAGISYWLNTKKTKG